MAKRSYIFLVTGCAVLTGCALDRLAFWSDDGVQKDYTVEGLSDQPETQDYIQSIINDRFAAVDIEDNEDRDLALDYHEEAVRRDVQKAMRAKGYYNAAVSFEEGQDTYHIEPGQITHIEAIHIRPDQYTSYRDVLTVSEGAPLKAQDVLTAQSKLYNKIQAKNCAFTLDVSHRVLLDTDANTAEITFTVDQGTSAEFGAVTFSGAETVKRSYLRKVNTIEEGTCFRRDKIEKVREDLLSSGLFSTAEVKLPSKKEAGKVIPVEFALKERAQRTIKAGLSYYTDEGPGVSFGWEHRNFLGGAEKMNVDVKVNRLVHSAEATLNKPFFLRKDQSLNINAFLDGEDTDAYETLGLGSGFNIKRELSDTLSARLGADLELTRIKDKTDESEENYFLLSPYGGITYDSRDDALNPTEGLVLKGLVKPFFDMGGNSSPFLKVEGTAQSYLQLHERFILAGRMTLGSISGTNTEDVPATERFYAGGGGSVRGFGYQEVGPFEDGDPVGGRSLFEASTEARFKLTDKIGAVAFVDAGHVGDKVNPDFDTLSVGAGAGVRYFTDFGPLRLDVGVPVSGDSNTDRNFQLYISIGQAF